MKDGKTDNAAGQLSPRELTDRQVATLDELQVKGENGVSGMYRRALAAVKTRLIMDDDYEPTENLSLARVITMLEQDIAILSGSDVDDDEAE